AGCGLWIHQNGLLPWTEMQHQATEALETRDLTPLQQTATNALNKTTKPLEMPGLPHSATQWIDGWNAGAAGLLLMLSLLFRGNMMGVLVLPGAGVAAVGHQHGIRTVEPFRAEHVAIMLGTVLALVGFRSSR